MPHPLHATFWRNHFVIPLIIFISLALYLELSGIDAVLADKIYAWEGGNWTLKNAWVTKILIHQTGKYFSLAVALLVLITTIATYLSPRLLKFQRELLFLLCAAAGCSGLISILKSISHVSCPWDFTRYGGELPYASIFNQIIHLSGEGCFPAGHASGGYSWLAFYFLGLHRQSRWRWAGLGFALGVGLIFGISQQLRGAHFITHDLWTLAICWFFSLFMYKLMLLGKSPSHSKQEAPMAFFRKLLSPVTSDASPRARLLSRKMSATRFTLLCAALFIVFFNSAFFKAFFIALPIHDARSAFFFLSLTWVATAFTALIISVIVLPKITKPIMAFIFIAAASAAYFMNTYGIVIHQNMIQNTMETDTKEAAGLLNTTLAIYIFVLGIIPSLLLLKVDLQFGSIKQEAWKKIKLWAVLLLSITLAAVPLTADYASFVRNNKNLRQMINPVNFIYATISYASASNKSISVKPIGEDAKLNLNAANQTKPILFVLVVGETARADHFSINGYDKPTTPLIAQQDIINYRQVFSCGTETAVSVPCMFSNLTRAKYSDKKAKSQEGLLDILKRSGYSVLWRDNNSSCKGTCDRVDYEPVKDLKIPEYCNDRECFDNILLHEIDAKLTAKNGSKVIVLHPKGSHGPDYYNRYPEDMEVFKPVCKVNKLQDCTTEQINNAFDNTIHMTDLFLNNTIEWLKSKSDSYNTAMIYLSDHGESLGENNLYLHGMPYLIAPIEQKHVPFFFWFSPAFEQDSAINRQCLHEKTNNEYSHDNLFHTMLGLLNVSTSLYNSEMDMTAQCRQ